MSFTSFREFVTVVEAKFSGRTGSAATRQCADVESDVYRSEGPSQAFHWNRRTLRICGAAVALAAVAGAPMALSESEAARVIGACWLLWLLRLASGLATRSRIRGAVLIIDYAGITDRRLSAKPLYWQDIATVDPVDLDRSRVVELFLRHPCVATAGRRPWIRFGGWLQRRFDLPALTLNLVLLDADASEVVGAIARFHPGAVPHTLQASVNDRIDRGVVRQHVD